MRRSRTGPQKPSVNTDELERLKANQYLLGIGGIKKNTFSFSTSFIIFYASLCPKVTLPFECTDISLTSAFINLSVRFIREKGMCYNNIPVTTRGSGPL